MKRGIIWIVLTCLMVTSLVLASCNKTTTTSTSTSTSTTTSTTTTTKTSVTTTTTSPTTSTTTASGNWWDSLGTPQYGGEMVLRIPKDIVNFDPYNSESLCTIESGWLETLHASDWTLDPAVFDYKISWRPPDYVKGLLAESWEFPDPSTYVVHLRKGIYWQDIPPVNGREFTAADVAYHYHRLFGLGDGFTKPASYWGTVTAYQSLKSVTAIDKYTVVFSWKITNPEFIMETLQAIGPSGSIEAREAVEKWGDLNDWHQAIGTGPFILEDFISGSSATLIKNPNYWGYDERYPRNKLPYVDTVKYLIIPDSATALAAMRAGKIDFIDGLAFTQGQSMKKTNPEMLQILTPANNTPTVDPRNDKAPFNDIRVRKAMQMAIDLPAIAKSYYGGNAELYPSSLTSRYLKGWGFPYEEWPEDLKDEYAYNPTAAKKLLADAGYPNGFNTDIVVDSAADLDLLQIVKSYFAQVGINMDIRTMDSASWSAFVQTGKKHDQLAERSSGTLGLNFEPFRQITRLQTGQSSNYAMVSDPVLDAFYPKAMAATDIAGVKQVVRDENEYVARQHFVISLGLPNLFAFYQPWFKGFNAQYQSLSGSVGPLLLGFYGSRFWVDQNLKKSMGH